MTTIIGATAYDSVAIGGALRVTFGKAYFWQSADEFSIASKEAFDNLPSVAHVARMQPTLPLVDGDTTWTLDVRNQTTRTVAAIIQAINAACNRAGLNVVEVESVAVLSPESILASNTPTGAQQRAAADVAGAATASSNPLDTAKSAFQKFIDELSTAGKWILGAVVILIVIWFVLNRKR